MLIVVFVDMYTPHEVFGEFKFPRFPTVKKMVMVSPGRAHRGSDGTSVALVLPAVRRKFVVNWSTAVADPG